MRFPNGTGHQRRCPGATFEIISVVRSRDEDAGSGLACLEVTPDAPATILLPTGSRLDAVAVGFVHSAKIGDRRVLQNALQMPDDRQKLVNYFNYI
jgi:hypothetical protein